jgi:hypothetical protein
MLLIKQQLVFECRLRRERVNHQKDYWLLKKNLAVGDGRNFVSSRNMNKEHVQKRVEVATH